MQKKTEEHVFQGMQRDMSISKQKAEFLWDANNIRLTSRHGDTLFSMTNERGTKQIDNIVFDGIVLGYCVLGDYLTVFTTNGSDGSKPDHIYRVDKSGDGFILNELYNGNLKFNVNKPIECLGVYENVDIQKVYWTDGENQPRFINIVNQHTDYINTSFDFIPTLALKDSISVRKVADSSGIFAAGVIQYAVTYYNKYGQESNISVVSPLIATSYISRAGSPEDTIGNAFKVTISNLDMQFEYVRLYSIFRSSKDTTPVCKRVADVKLGSGSGTRVTSKELYISNDRKSVRWSGWDIVGSVQTGNYSSFQTDPDSNFVEFRSLPADSQYKGTETVTVDGITFNADRYYHFSKKDYPRLIIKAWLYHDGLLDSKPTFLTWNTNTTGIYLTLGTVGGFGNQPIIWCTGSGIDSDMISASDIHYESAWIVDGSEITITDNGTIGEDVDYNQLLFVGGEEITAGTITQKDGTMFLGDIAIKRPQIKGAYDVNTDIQNYECKATGTQLIKTITDGTSISKSHRTCYFPLTMNSSSYKWGNTLDACSDSARKNSTNIAGFKWGEHYRLGLQFQYKTGKWSQPVFIGDVKMDDVNQRPSLATDNGQCVQNVPSFLATLSKTAGDEMLANDYKRVRAVVCFPTESDQLILCQGLLNPTVHSIAGRINHTPDVQSSWYFRPVPTTNDVENDIPYPQYKDKWTLFSGERSGATTYIPTRHDEIQGSPIDLSDIPISEYFDTDTYELNNPITINPHIGNITGDDLNHTVTDS